MLKEEDSRGLFDRPPCPRQDHLVSDSLRPPLALLLLLPIILYHFPFGSDLQRAGLLMVRDKSVPVLVFPFSSRAERAGGREDLARARPRKLHESEGALQHGPPDCCGLERDAREDLAVTDRAISSVRHGSERRRAQRNVQQSLKMTVDCARRDGPGNVVLGRFESALDLA